MPKYALFRSLLLHDKRRVCSKSDISQQNKESRGSGNYWFVPNTLLYLNTNLFSYIILLYTYLFNYNSLSPIANLQKSVLL